MVNPRSIVNSLSLSRIRLGLLFVICFQRTAVFLYLSGALWKVASTYGRFWDSMGDKSFYAAVIIAFNAQGFLSPLISWALIAREVALYVTRILFSEKLPNIERIRPWTNWHGYLMHLTLVLGLLRMYAEIHNLSFQINPYIQLSAFAALAFGVISIFKFLQLD